MTAGATEAGELRAVDDVAAWLGAGMLLCRVPATAELDAVIAGAMVACAVELAGLPPPGMIADLAALLAGVPLPLAPALAVGGELRAAVRSYDDDVLARLVRAARYDDVLAAYAHVAAGDRPAAIALIVGAICERVGFHGLAVSPAALRRALARPRDERDRAGRTALAGAIADRLADGYHRIARGARQSHALVGDGEVFALDHLAVLRGFGGRLTVAHITAAAEALDRTLPRRLPALRLQRGDQTTQMADDTLYPAGGFTAITQGGADGNLENLVTSELVYMEDGAETDVFSVRYAESELLYYTRDDSEFHRHRHVIGFILAPDLEAARVKDRELPWQRLVVALALVVVAVRWLVDQLGDRALAIDVCFPPRRLAEERAILALLLEAEIARGSVRVVEQPAGEALAAVAAAKATALADAIVVAMGAGSKADIELPAGLRELRVELDQIADWTAWCDVAEDVLRWLV